MHHSSRSQSLHALRENPSAVSPHLCTSELCHRAVWWPPCTAGPWPGGQRQVQEKGPLGSLSLCNQCCCCFAASEKDASCWERMPDAAQSLGAFLPLPHTGNALLLAQRNFILTAETFIGPKELVQYNSPHCTAASPMSHMQSQGKAWMLRKALHDLSAQRYIQLKQCHFCLTFWWLPGETQMKTMAGKVCVSPADTLCLFTYKHVERGKKLAKFLMCLIAQQQQKANWQCLSQPALAGSSRHHMPAQTLTTAPNKPHGSLDTP